MNKRVGIITVHHYHNYGSVLQALAIQNYIEHLGYNAEIIDYRPPELFYNTSELYDFDNPREKINLKGNIKKALEMIGVVVRKDSYSDFRKHLNLTSKIYSVNDLYKNPPCYDVYVAGSDQIWNPYITCNNPAYFLTFVKTGRKISYATSIGVTRIPENIKPDFIRGINNFDRVSVREKDNKNLVYGMTGVSAEWVIDPTLLLTVEDWKKYSDGFTGEHAYILCYFLGSNSFCETLYKRVQADLNLPVVYIGTGNDSAITPSRFISLFMNARFIVTNSFHGMAFAVNFNKPFAVTYRNADSETSMNSRHTSFLELFGLQNSLFVEGDILPDFNGYSIDYNSVNKILLSEREKAKEYLVKAIEGQD